METIYLLLAVLGGVAIRFLYKWATALRTEKEFALKLAIISAVLSLVTNTFLIFVRADVEAILPITYLTAGIYGYLGDSIFRGVVKNLKPDFNKK